MGKSSKTPGKVIPFPGSSSQTDAPDFFATSSGGPTLGEPDITDEEIQLVKDEMATTNEALTLTLAFMNAFMASEGRKVLKTTTEFRWSSLGKLKAQGLIDYNAKKQTITFTEYGVDVALATLKFFADMYRTMVDLKRKPIPTFSFRLDLDLDGRTCRRQIRVPQSYSFADFHHAIQIAFGWLDYHMYDFRLTHNKRKVTVVERDRQAIDGMFAQLKLPSGEQIDAHELYLDEVFPRTRKALYLYDYGDSWEVTVTLVGQETYPRGEELLCEDGEGDAPPEDVGSAPGFERFLKIIGNPKDPEYQETVDWADEQGFMHFDLDFVNEEFAQSRVTIYGV